MSQYDDLKRAAEACAALLPIRYMESHGALFIRNDHGIVFDVHQNRDFPAFMAANKAYADLVLAANPAVVMALLAENDRLATELSACTEVPGGCGYWREATWERERQIDQLKADLDEARNGMKHQAALSLKKEIERLNADNASLKGSCSQLGAEHTGMARALKTANRLLTEANAERGRLMAEVEAFKEANTELSRLNEMRRNHLVNAKKAAGIGHDDDLVGAIEALRKERDKLADENRSLLEDPGSAL